jgi:signal transduction histidine kinase
MSHEVNNTIAITNSLLESCLHYKTQLDAESGDDFDDAINIVIKRSESLNKFMQAYASVVKLEKPIKTSFNLSKMLQDLGTLFFAQCDKLNIKISVNAKDDINIVADANLLEQALVNLIQNAVEAIGENGEIIIDLTQSQSEKVLKISDTGCGINSDIERQLFTPFFTSKEFGQGVGLMLVREILRLHDIEHSLNNREDKKGAVFTWVIEDS